MNRSNRRLQPLCTGQERKGCRHARALRSYLYQMQEQLQYVLTNLDTENMSDTLRSKLQGL